MGAPRAGTSPWTTARTTSAEIGEGWLDAGRLRIPPLRDEARFLSTPYMGLVNENGTDVRFYAGYLIRTCSDHRLRPVVNGCRSSPYGLLARAHRLAFAATLGGLGFSRFRCPAPAAVLSGCRPGTPDPLVSWCWPGEAAVGSSCVQTNRVPRRRRTTDPRARGNWRQGVSSSSPPPSR